MTRMTRPCFNAVPYNFIEYSVSQLFVTPSGVGILGIQILLVVIWLAGFVSGKKCSIWPVFDLFERLRGCRSVLL